MTGIDWRDARVVRDAAGVLWLRDPHEQMWTAHADYDTGWQRAELERVHGPLVPVLDAEGLPVVDAMLPALRVIASMSAHSGRELAEVARMLIEVGERCQSVVRTVGDLTALHVGRRVRVGVDSGSTEGVLRRIEFRPGSIAMTIVHEGHQMFPRTRIDTPCEVLP